MIPAFKKQFVFKMVRYFISGGSAALIDLGALYVLTDLVHLWYLASATIAFVLALVTSFVLQKFWTFSNVSAEKIHTQFGRYLALSITNIFVNTGLMYVFVTELGLPYLLAQVGAIAIIACYGFVLYQTWIFREKHPVAAAHDTP